MASSNLNRRSIIAQPNNETNEMNEVSDEALAELKRQMVENEKQYQEQLKRLKEKRRKSEEENSIMEKSPPSASPFIDLNVGGEKMSTSRATLTLVEGTSLATMFSGKSDDKLTKDADGYIFLDYDPVVSRNFECSSIILSIFLHLV